MIPRGVGVPGAGAFAGAGEGTIACAGFLMGGCRGPTHTALSIKLRGRTVQAWIRVASHVGSKVLIAGLALLCTGLASAGEPVATSGRELYGQYCASCHGIGGLGDGPVAASLSVEVPDLTRLAIRRGGFFDRDRVERIIDGRFVIGAHGTRTMPVWGEALSRSGIGDPNAERATRIVIGRLADYLWQLQRPAQSKRSD
jgi:mono/diheme cytochrome c family protein